MQFKGRDVFLSKSTYPKNGRISIQIYDAEDGIAVARATVNLPDVEMKNGYTAIKDHSENIGVLNFLVENRIVAEPEFYSNQGYVEIPICKVL